MNDVSTLKEIATMFEKMANTARAKAAEHAHAKEPADAEKQDARAGRAHRYCKAIRAAIRELDQPKAKRTTGQGSDAFCAFWKAYPPRRKTDRPRCVGLWEKMNLDERAAEVMASLERQKRSIEWTKEGGEFVPGPAVWLLRMGWNDELSSAASMRAANPIADPPRWYDFLKEKNQPVKPFTVAAPHLKSAFAEWERANGF